MFRIVRIETNPQSDVLPECDDVEVPTKVIVRDMTTGEDNTVLLCMEMDSVHEPAHVLGILTGMGFTPNDWDV
jgi:hypothetical protein